MRDTTQEDPREVCMRGYREWCDQHKE
jgi:hypothetical protein